MKLRIVVVLALVGCGGSTVVARYTRVTGPDGTRNWAAVECRKSAADCYEMAGKACPGGYEIADAEGQHGSETTSSATASSFGNGGPVVARGRSRTDPTFHGSMLVHCKTSLAETP